jgi:pimeloyl-ACP methyl ester carboxylesterase
MKHFAILTLLLLMCFISTAWPQALKPTQPLNQNAQLPHFPRWAGLPQMPQPFERVGPAIAQASASEDVVWIQCPPEAESFGVPVKCGTLPVPLDREHPKQGTINIYFELYVHSGLGPAESAFLFNPGLPGLATSGVRLLVLASSISAILDVHDILLIDDRGRGFSGTIVCNPLQYGTETFNPAVADCAAQLGDAASRYGTGEIAQDAEAVRAALGYDKVDYYGNAYGGGDVAAYATRFGEHLRSVVLDGPTGTPLLDETRFVADQWSVQSVPGMVSLDCRRSPTCSADHPFPEFELDSLIWTVRLNPVEGDAYDANGNLVHVRFDEEGLLSYVLDSINTSGTFVNYGEILAAADALWRGDSGPLLRLGAEGYAPLDHTNYGDPTFFSKGAGLATTCVDMHEPWDWSTPVSERTNQFANTVSALPTWYFAPFSKQAVTSEQYNSLGRDCLYWQKPTPSSPMTPHNASYPSTPTLVLTGEFDNIIPTDAVRKVAALYPNSTVVPVAGAGHVSLLWSQCAIGLASSFIKTLQVGDTTCAKTPETIWAAVGRFPLVAADARPATVDPNGQNKISLHERKVVTVAVATATDALQRSIIGSGSGVGLRAGTFQTTLDASGNQITTLAGCAFTKDVAVFGPVTWGADRSFVADLTVSGSGTAGGTLHVEGTWQAPGPVGNFKVSGTLGGKQVAVLVPEA